MSEPAVKQRIDKWLWQARFFKTRTLAAKQVSAGHVRVNGTRVNKPAQAVGLEDVLTFPQGRDVRVIRIVAIGARRGPAPEAQALYEDLTPVPDETEKTPPARVGERPTKRDRRALDALRGKTETPGS
ncbi:MAG: RNA-binding S4 domain-containing protein [Arenibacterium sp.]